MCALMSVMPQVMLCVGIFGTKNMGACVPKFLFRGFSTAPLLHHPCLKRGPLIQQLLGLKWGNYLKEGGHLRHLKLGDNLSI